MPITVVNNNSLISALQQTNPITINLPSAVDMSTVALQAATEAITAKDAAEEAAEESALYGGVQADGIADWDNMPAICERGGGWIPLGGYIVAASAADLADPASTINTKGKVIGRLVRVSDTGAIVYATSVAAGGIWNFMDGSIAYNP